MKCCNCKNLGKLKDEDGEPYDWCEKVCDCPDTKMERNCRHFEIATNADRIRSMTDEELAELFIKIQDDVADYYDSGHAYAPELPTMKESWLDWLRQEASDA